MNIDEATELFFSRHWVRSAIGSEPPRWVEWKSFLFGPVPNHDKAGCYALFRNTELVYVGLGASKGSGIYTEHGLATRLMKNVLCKDWSKEGDWAKLNPKWDYITSLRTIGFAADTSYLAASLESFLIRQLRPPENKKV